MQNGPDIIKKGVGRIAKVLLKNIHHKGLMRNIPKQFRNVI